MKHALMLIVLILLALPTPLLSAHQPAAAPIVLYADGNLLTVDPATGALDSLLASDGALRSVRLSPDGTRIAYSALAPLSVEALERVGGIGGGPLPADIHVIDIASGADTPIATQPPDALFLVDSVNDSALLRSFPSWSPDGTRLAWSEVHYPSHSPESNRLLVYDFATGSTQVIATHLPPHAYIPGPQDVLWGAGGLAVQVETFEENADGSFGGFFSGFEIFDPDRARLVAQYLESADDMQATPAQYAWITMDRQSYLGSRYSDNRWVLFDPATRTRTAAPQPPQLYARNAPNSSLGLEMEIDPNADRWATNRIWTIVAPDGTRTPLPYQGHHVALSPDGSAVAYAAPDGGLSIWQDGAVMTVLDESTFNLDVDIFWGGMAWRIGSAPPVPASTVQQCPGALPSRLRVNGQAHVIPGQAPNNIRAQPNTGGAQVGQIPPGEVFPVLAGPECADGFAWWKVDYAGTVGWTAEGDAATYWLGPVE
jgi:hypothetical protein